MRSLAGNPWGEQTITETGSPWKGLRRVGLTAGVCCLLTIVLFAAASGVAAADQHDPDSAQTYDSAEGEANLTVTLPDQTDHYPGDQNDKNASIELSIAAQEAFTEQDAEEGLWLDRLMIETEWIDFSACSGAKAGIDRGNNNSGTQTDASLRLEHTSSSEIDASGIRLEFFNWEAVSGNPPYLTSEDAVVLAIGQFDGPCLTMTDEPGWYQAKAYFNGTVATSCTEEGNETCEPDEKQFRGLTVTSNYVYVCECDDRQEAIDILGLPPNVTPTPTPSPTSTPELTATDPSKNAPTDTDAEGDGPGMGAVTAMVALLTAVLAARQTALR